MSGKAWLCRLQGLFLCAIWTSGLPPPAHGLRCVYWGAEDSSRLRPVSSQRVGVHLAGLIYSYLHLIFNCVFTHCYLEPRVQRQKSFTLTSYVPFNNYKLHENCSNTALLPNPTPSSLRQHKARSFLCTEIFWPSTNWIKSPPPFFFLTSTRSFSGFASTEKYAEEAEVLAKILRNRGQAFHEDFFYTAGYDSPFKLFNRHNEVWYFKK